MKVKIYIIFFFLCLLLPKGGVAKLAIQQTPRNFDPEFKERYQSRNYNYDGETATTAYKNKKSKNGENAPYKDKIPSNRENNNPLGFNGNGFFMPIAIIVLILAIVYIVYILLNDGTHNLFTNRRSKKIEEETIITDIIRDANLESLIKQAEANKDYRLAIRYNYLSVLKKLSLQGIIAYETEKTNGEYQDEIKDEKLLQKFSYISYLYNYIWYGEFYVTENQYKKAKHNFTLLP